MFLNVIQVGLKSENPQPTSARLVEADEGVGLVVELSGSRLAQMTFKNGVGGHITFQEIHPMSVGEGEKPVTVGRIREYERRSETAATTCECRTEGEQ